MLVCFQGLIWWINVGLTSYLRLCHWWHHDWEQGTCLWFSTYIPYSWCIFSVCVCLCLPVRIPDKIVVSEKYTDPNPTHSGDMKHGQNIQTFVTGHTIYFCHYTTFRRVDVILCLHSPVFSHSSDKHVIPLERMSVTDLFFLFVLLQ